MILTQTNAYKHQGKREYQEDSFAYGKNYLLVSDGVGGLAKGDIASDIVSSIFSEQIEKLPQKADKIEEWAKHAIINTLQQLYEYAKNNQQSMGMGATLAMLLQIENTLVSVHIGDSRVYHFGKDGNLKWRSKDHSLVQELINAEIITEEQAETHPKKNVITRVLQAKKGIKVKAAIHIINNIENGDVFFVCSDGVTETWTDIGLTALMKLQNTQKIIGEIEQHCSKHSNDNNTAIIAKIGCTEEETLNIIPVNETVATTSNEAKEIVFDDNYKKPIWRKYSILFLAGLILIAAYFIVPTYIKTKENKENIIEKQEQRDKTSNKKKNKEQSSIEKERWEWAVKENNNGAYNTYLKEYPEGKYAKEARVRIKKMNENAKIEKEDKNRTDKEEQKPGINELENDDGIIIEENPIFDDQTVLWNKITQKPTILNIQDYINKYPEGKYINEATELLKKIDTIKRVQ